MLEEVRIEALGVIEDAVLELSPRFTVLTGETGAGKTMVLSGLGLLLGGRADSALVRTGATRSLVEGRLLIDPSGAVAARAEQAGAEVEADAAPGIAAPADATLLLSRSVTRDGRSRAHLGGRAVPAGLLAELAEDLVAIHGQSDQLGLLQPARQRAALDRYAGQPVAAPLGRYRSAYQRWRALDAELHDVRTRARERAHEADLLRLGVAEVAAVDPQPEEDVLVAAELARLMHADGLRTAALTAHRALLGDPDAGSETGPDADAVGLVGAARRDVDREREHDAELAGLADRLAEAGYLLADVAADLASYAAGIDADAGHLAQAQQRTSALAGLTRKYGDTVTEVLAWAGAAEIRLGELDGDDERLERLQAERSRVREDLAGAAAELSAARSAAASRLGAAVGAELRALAMPAAEVAVTVVTAENLGPYGADEVGITLVPHPGAPARPLHKGASGGELSRVMLALEVVLAGADPVPTFVFDEVDAGVGGAAALEVGRRLARLARSAQVIVVTHLPQVAAFADRHLLVTKADDGAVTRSGVRTLDGPGQVRELSRMLAGVADSAAAAATAEELLAAAAQAKNAPPR